jgi:hypothetical protein
LIKITVLADMSLTKPDTKCNPTHQYYALMLEKMQSRVNVNEILTILSALQVIKESDSPLWMKI